MNKVGVEAEDSNTFMQLSLQVDSILAPAGSNVQLQSSLRRVIWAAMRLGCPPCSADRSAATTTSHASAWITWNRSLSHTSPSGMQIL